MHAKFLLNCNRKLQIIFHISLNNSVSKVADFFILGKIHCAVYFKPAHRKLKKGELVAGNVINFFSYSLSLELVDGEEIFS
jgi:hypothetical protein